MASIAPKNLDIFQKFSSKLYGECESGIFVVFNGDWIFLCVKKPSHEMHTTEVINLKLNAWLAI